MLSVNIKTEELNKFKFSAANRIDSFAIFKLKNQLKK